MYEFESFEPAFNGADSGVFLLDPEARQKWEAVSGEGLNVSDEVKEADAHARFLRKAKELPDVRMKKILEIRRQIANGTYETEEKLQEAVNNLLRDLK